MALREREPQPLTLRILDRLSPKRLVGSFHDFLNGPLEEILVFNQFRNMPPDWRERQLAYLEDPSHKPGIHLACQRLRELWGLPLEPNIEAVIVYNLINRNVTNWDRVRYGRDQILLFLQSGAGSARREIIKNLEEAWRGEEATMMVRARLLGNPRRSFLDGIFETVGVTQDQTLKEQLARLMDPYFQESKAFQIGQEWCKQRGVSRETAISWGIEFGFVKRNTLDLIGFREEKARTATLGWLRDDDKAGRDLSEIASRLCRAWSY